MVLNKITYDDIADSYNKLYKEEQIRKLNKIFEEISFKKIDLILDVGCGTGVATSSMICKKVGIDPSFKLLVKAPFPKVFGKGESLPFADKSFDYVICLTAIHNFEDFKKGLSEMKRVCKKMIIVSILKHSKKFNEIKKYIEKKFNVKTIDEAKDEIFLI